jgi:hypothetical protein
MFDLILEDIEGQFATIEWTTSEIAIFPDNYQGKKKGKGKDPDEYCLLSVLPASSKNYAYDSRKQLNGLVAVKMFVKAGAGQGRLMSIADILDTLLENKQLTNGTQLGTSYMNVEGLDPSNKSLYSASYLIPFTIYGE